MIALAVAFALVGMSLWLSYEPRTAIFSVCIVLVFQGILTRNLSANAGQLVQYLDEITLVAGLVRVAVLMATGDRSWWRWRDWTWAGIFLVIGVLSSIANGGGLAATSLGLLQVGKLIGWLVVIRSIPWQRSDGRRVVVAFAVASVLLLITGLFGFLNPDFVLAHVVPDNPDLISESIGRGEAQGTAPFLVPFVHPGFYGWAAAVTALAAIALVVETRSRRAAAGVLAGVVGVVLSLRRKPLMGVPLALLFALGRLTRRQRTWLVGVGLVGALTIAVVARDQLDLIIEDTIDNYLDADRDDQARFVMAYVGADLATSHFPLGVGLGRFGSAPSLTYYSEVYEQTGLANLPGFSSDPDEPHYMMDAYWQHLLGEVGWLGTLAMLVFLLQLLRHLRATHRKATDVDERLIALFGFMVLAEALVESLASPLFEAGLEPLILALPIGIALRLATPAPFEDI